MGQTTDQIEHEIDRTRDELMSNLEELESRVKEAADWREQFKKRPGAMVAAAAVGGMLLAAMIGRK